MMRRPARNGTCGSWGWRLSSGVGVIGVLAMSVGAVAWPVQTTVATKSMVSEVAGRQSTPRMITVTSDQEKARGITSGPGGAEAVVYANTVDQGNWTVNGQRFNYASQSSLGATNDLGFDLSIGTYIADDMTMGGGWVLGDPISSFSAFVRRSGGDDTRTVGDGTTTATVTLWDGDPAQATDTTGGGFLGAPIPGATCDFTLDPAVGFGTLQDLKCNLATPITPVHDNLWMVLTSESCRLFWSLTLLQATVGSSRDLGQLGQDDDAGVIGSFTGNLVATDGVCCASGAPCGPSAVALDCDGGTTNGSGRCSDGDAETHFTFNFGGPCIGDPATDQCINYLAQINAPASTTISLVPVARCKNNASLPCKTDSDCPSPGDTCDGGPNFIGINGNEISYSAGGGMVALDVRVSNWDPNGTGTLLRAWQAGTDPTSYTSGLQGTLTLPSIPCVTAADCLAVFGGVCSVLGTPCKVDGDCPFAGPPLNETCGGLKCDLRFVTDPVGSEVCHPGYILTQRNDYVFRDLLEALAVDLTNKNGAVRWASALNGSPSVPAPSPFPIEDLYLASLQLEISPNAAGTFTVELLSPPDSVLVDDNTVFIPLLGLVPAEITIQTGQCCDAVVVPSVCLSDTVTAGQCSALGGSFAVGKTCADACATACCLPGGGCLAQTTDCALLGGTPVAACLGDGNGNGTDDACDGIIPSGEDCWDTACGRTQVSFADQPIPAGFFSPGSDAFSGTILLGGGAAGLPDTRVHRTQTVVLTGIGATDTTPIEITELNLVSCDPIQVIDLSGTSLWNVQVGLSVVPEQQGTMTITKTHDNGGTFTTSLPVQPRISFSSVTNPGEIRVLDTGLAGQPPVILNTVGAASWIHTPYAGTIASPCGVNFIPGIEEDPVNGTQCCRKVGHAGPNHFHETAVPDCSACPPITTGACCEPVAGGCAVVEGILNCAGDYKGDGTDCFDTDGDGLADVFEDNTCGGPPGDRCNVPTNPAKLDTDGDGCSDGDEVVAGTDPCDRCSPAIPCGPVVVDCNNNGKFDSCDIRNGIGFDANNNGLLDECELGACCYKPFGSPVCFITKELGLTGSIDPPASCEIAGNPIWYPVPSTWYGPGTNCSTFQGAVQVLEGGTIFNHQVGSPEDCPVGLTGQGGVARACTGTLIDPWASKPSVGTMCHNFGATGGGPIPADFFCPDGSPNCGSDAFAGVVCLKGSPLGMTQFGDFGEADTLVSRTADPFGRCALPSPNPVNVDVQVAALNLVGESPVIVTFNGSLNPEAWDVRVDLSTTVTTAFGTVSAIKTHCNGGTYTSSLNVQPRFTFTRRSDGLVRVFDTGTAGLSSITLSQLDAAPWVNDVDPVLGLTSDPCSEFHAGIEEVGALTTCDCNANAVRDQCDIENGIPDCNANGVPDSCEVPAPGGSCTVNCVADCNANGVPDVCEPDCNGNGITDSCDIADCPVGDLTCQDCNANGVPDGCEPDCNGNGIPDGCDLASASSFDCNANGRPDECDAASGSTADCNTNAIPDACELAGGAPDINNNGILDVCECFPSTAAVGEQILSASGATVASVKNRFLSFSGGDAGFLQAVRVKIVSLPGAFSIFDGTSMWVDTPVTVSELPGKTFTDPVGAEASFLLSRLRTTPVYADWSTFGMVHVIDERIIPSRQRPALPLEPAVYEIQLVTENCNTGLEASFSPALSITNARWGDVGELIVGEFLAPDAVVSIGDALGMIAKFAADGNAPSKARAELLGTGQLGPVARVDGKISVSDMLEVLSAFGGGSYPFAPPPVE